MVDAQPLKLGYWHTRGRAQPVRFLLEYAGVPYEDKLYTLSAEKKGEWFDQDKQQLPITYPNLPYIQDGDYFLSESVALLQYAAEKSGDATIFGRDARERATIQQVTLIVHDLRVPIRAVAWQQEDRQAAYDKVQPALKRFESEVQKHKWIVGDNITTPDFYLYEVLVMYWGVFGEEEINKYPALKKYVQAFEALPRISAYLASDRYRKFEQLFPNVAPWTGKDFLAQYNAKFGTSQ